MSGSEDKKREITHKMTLKLLQPHQQRHRIR